MQKENPVIKNYILLTEKRILKEKNENIFTISTKKYSDYKTLKVLQKTF